MQHKFRQCVPANLETSCLLKIGEVSQKLRLRCGSLFPWCALTLTVPYMSLWEILISYVL
jgi:hypothetical protein